MASPVIQTDKLCLITSITHYDSRISKNYHSFLNLNIFVMISFQNKKYSPALYNFIRSFPDHKIVKQRVLHNTN